MPLARRLSLSHSFGNDAGDSFTSTSPITKSMVYFSFKLSDSKLVRLKGQTIHLASVGPPTALLVDSLHDERSDQRRLNTTSIRASFQKIGRAIRILIVST